MDNYELEIILKNLEHYSRQSVKRMIEEGVLSSDNIVDILFNWGQRLRQVYNAVNLYEDLNYQPKSED